MAAALFSLVVCLPVTRLMQGSHWSRLRRQFVTHNNGAQTLTTEVGPADIPAFAAAAGGSENGRFVMYSDAQKAVWVVDAAGNASVQLSRGESDLITVVPLTEVKGLCIAPIGAYIPDAPTHIPAAVFVWLAGSGVVAHLANLPQDLNIKLCHAVNACM